MNWPDDRGKQEIKDILLAVSLANLYFLWKWAEYFHAPYDYYRKEPYTWTTYSGILLNVLIFAMIFWLGKRLVSRSKSLVTHVLARIAFLAVLLVPLNLLRAKIGLKASTVMAYYPVIIAVGLAGLFILARWNQVVARAAATLVLLLFPFFLFNAGRIGWEMIRLSRFGVAKGDGPLAPFNEVRPGLPRVTWVILDELDQRVAFRERPPGLTLPELDRLRGESLSAERAVPPGGSTMVSMPALIVGRMLSGTVPSGGRDLHLTFSGATASVPWSTQSNLFSRARALGFNTGLVGWYHPYGRIIPSSLNSCQWLAYPPHDQRWGTDLYSVMQNQLLAGMPFHVRRLHQRAYLKSLADARQLAADARFGLTLCHLPVPHYPGIYDRRKNKLTTATLGTAEGYLGNLVLADQALGLLRKTMEQSGTWDTSTILVSSDHWWREAGSLDGKMERHVPFILKMPGNHQPITYSPEFNTVLTHDLILAVLRREITNHTDAVRWLDQNRWIAR